MIAPKFGSVFLGSLPCSNPVEGACWFCSGFPKFATLAWGVSFTWSDQNGLAPVCGSAFGLDGGSDGGEFCASGMAGT